MSPVNIPSSLRKVTPLWRNWIMNTYESWATCELLCGTVWHSDDIKSSFLKWNPTITFYSIHHSYSSNSLHLKTCNLENKLALNDGIYHLNTSPWGHHELIRQLTNQLKLYVRQKTKWLIGRLIEETKMGYFIAIKLFCLEKTVLFTAKRVRFL